MGVVLGVERNFFGELLGNTIEWEADSEQRVKYGQSSSNGKKAVCGLIPVVIFAPAQVLARIGDGGGDITIEPVLRRTFERSRE